MEYSFQIKLIFMVFLISFSNGAQPFYPEASPNTEDIIFTSTSSTKLQYFVVSAAYFTSSLSNPNIYIKKQGIVLYPSNTSV